jgi:hypothetical protein
MVRACSTHGRDEKCIKKFWYENSRGREFGNLDVDGRIILKWILVKQVAKLWNGFISLRTETSDEVL